MPADISTQQGNGPERTFRMVLPGDQTVIAFKPIRAGLSEKVIAVCCDLFDEATDVFAFDKPAGWTEDTKEKLVTELSTPENLAAQLRDGQAYPIDLQALGLASTPSSLIMRHIVEMSPDVSLLRR